eukprot:TRINITY_DN15544_c0_g6_i1.p1 TRINITY_DN15544_c0_g6~~TRINITY_DN15544_c0_g6_i1.p1  ORF type:complete len:484 (+),score=36.12 TRINITY_DN15544_c0_g6_i1:91-1542(+)
MNLSTFSIAVALIAYGLGYRLKPQGHDDLQEPNSALDVSDKDVETDMDSEERSAEDIMQMDRVFENMRAHESRNMGKNSNSKDMSAFGDEAMQVDSDLQEIIEQSRVGKGDRRRRTILYEPWDWRVSHMIGSLPPESARREFLKIVFRRGYFFKLDSRDNRNDARLTDSTSKYTSIGSTCNSSNAMSTIEKNFSEKGAGALIDEQNKLFSDCVNKCNSNDSCAGIEMENTSKDMLKCHLKEETCNATDHFVWSPLFFGKPGYCCLASISSATDANRTVCTSCAPESIAVGDAWCGRDAGNCASCKGVWCLGRPIESHGVSTNPPVPEQDKTSTYCYDNTNDRNYSTVTRVEETNASQTCFRAFPQDDTNGETVASGGAMKYCISKPHFKGRFHCWNPLYCGDYEYNFSRLEQGNDNRTGFPAEFCFFAYPHEPSNKSGLQNIRNCYEHDDSIGGKFSHLTIDDECPDWANGDGNFDFWAFAAS